MNPFYPSTQNARLVRAQEEVRRNRVTPKDSDFRAARLEGRVDRLAMVCAALWDLVKEHTELTEEDLFRRVEDIDLRDGVLDGKVARETITCVKCGRVMSARHSQCLYCGTPRPVDTAFDEVL
jgi:hypothetical protein